MAGSARGPTSTRRSRAPRPSCGRWSRRSRRRAPAHPGRERAAALPDL